MQNKLSDTEISERFQELWQEEHPEIAVEEKLQAWNEDKGHIMSAKKPKVRKLWIPVAAAAAISLLVMVSLPYFLNNNTDIDQSSFVTIEASAQGVTQVTLPDNTHVLLSPNAQIQYSKDFDKRDISLQGTAYFNVTKNPLKPFTIQTGSWTSTVLGTSFNMAYENNQLQVNLYEGKLQLIDSLQSQNTFILQAGNTFTSNTSTVATLFTSTSQWVDFTDASLIEVLGYLESTQGKRFVFDKSLQNVPVTIRIDTDASLDSILPTLSIITSLQFNEKESEIQVQ